MCLGISYKKKKTMPKNFFGMSVKKGVGSRVGSGSVNQRYGSAPKMARFPNTISDAEKIGIQMKESNHFVYLEYGNRSWRSP
jgi:hypothetical protein